MLSHCVFVLIKMSTVVYDFEKLRTEYKLCPDFFDIYTILEDGVTQEVDGYTLQNGYLLLGLKLCTLRILLRKFLVWELHVVV